MKIAMINTVNLEDNGITTFIIDNSILLAQNGISVTIIAPNKISSFLKRKLELNNIKVLEIPFRSQKPLMYFRVLLKYLKKEKFNVVHVNGNSTTMSIELLAATFAGIKGRIAHSHNTTTDHPTLNKILRPLFDLVVNGRIACNNSAGKWLFRNKQFKIIKNGIFLENYFFSKISRNNIRKKLNIKDNDILLGHVGRFNNQKNKEYFLKLMTSLPKKYYLILIGNGINFDKIKCEIQKNNLENRIILTGAINNISSYLCAIDLFLLPSRYEGQPFTLVESTASGLDNIVSTSVPKENNIVDNISYLELNNLNMWKNSIEQYDFSNLRTNREKRSKEFIKILKNNGYDVETNVHDLISLYTKVGKL